MPTTIYNDVTRDSAVTRTMEGSESGRRTTGGSDERDGSGLTSEFGALLLND